MLLGAVQRGELAAPPTVEVPLQQAPAALAALAAGAHCGRKLLLRCG